MRRALETQATENAALLRAWVKQQQQLVAQQAQHDEVFDGVGIVMCGVCIVVCNV